MINVPVWVWISALVLLALLAVGLVLIVCIWLGRMTDEISLSVHADMSRVEDGLRDLASVLVRQGILQGELEELREFRPHPLFGKFPQEMEPDDPGDEEEPDYRPKRPMNGHDFGFPGNRNDEDPLKELARLIGQADPFGTERGR